MSLRNRQTHALTEDHKALSVQRACPWNFNVRYRLKATAQQGYMIYAIDSCRYHNPRVPKWNVDQICEDYIYGTPVNENSA